MTPNNNIFIPLFRFLSRKKFLERMALQKSGTLSTHYHTKTIFVNCVADIQWRAEALGKFASFFPDLKDNSSWSHAENSNSLKVSLSRVIVERISSICISQLLSFLRSMTRLLIQWSSLQINSFHPNLKWKRTFVLINPGKRHKSVCSALEAHQRELL